MVDLTETKAYLQLTSSTYDTLLNSYIGYITATIERYLNNKITPLTSLIDQDILILDGEKEISLNAFPVSNVSLKEGSNVLTINDYYNVDYESGTIYFNFLPSFGSGIYKVSYTYGYLVPNVPSELKFVALKLIKALFDSNKMSLKPGTGAGDIKAKKIADFSVTYGGSANENSQYEVVDTALYANKSILDKYKRVILF